MHLLYPSAFILPPPENKQGMILLLLLHHFLTRPCRSGGASQGRSWRCQQCCIKEMVHLRIKKDRKILQMLFCRFLFFFADGTTVDFSQSHESIQEFRRGREFYPNDAYRLTTTTTKVRNKSFSVTSCRFQSARCARCVCGLSGG